MKILGTLIALALLTGCSTRTFTPKSEQEFYSDSSKSKEIKIVPVVKITADKSKILPPLQATEPNGSLSFTTSFDSTIPLDSETFSPSRILEYGSRGDDVLVLEQRLSDLHYDVGIVDGFYGHETRQGVMSFQKYSGLERTGIYTQETQKALHMAMPPEGQYPELGFPRVEINLTRQVLLFFDEQGLNRVFPVSTGSNRPYCDISKKSGKQVCGVAHTPRGKFRIQRKIPGWRESDLGMLYNPLYFNGGFAIHGSPLVPEVNVSHGCIRIPILTAMWFYDAVKNGTPVIVFD